MRIRSVRVRERESERADCEHLAQNARSAEKNSSAREMAQLARVAEVVGYIEHTARATTGIQKNQFTTRLVRSRSPSISQGVCEKSTGSQHHKTHCLPVHIEQLAPSHKLYCLSSEEVVDQTMVQHRELHKPLLVVYQKQPQLYLLACDCTSS